MFPSFAALTATNDGAKLYPSSTTECSVVLGDGDVALRRRNQVRDTYNKDVVFTDEEERKRTRDIKWRRILLLTVAVTVHNIPEGMAVGVGFGAIGKGSMKATFESARNLAIGIGNHQLWQIKLDKFRFLYRDPKFPRGLGSEFAT